MPVPRDDLLIAALPNGHFRSDWNVFQNHALIRHLDVAHSYRCVGIGASWRGVVRGQVPNVEEARRQVADLALVDPSGDTAAATAAWDELAPLLTERATLLLGYPENFAE